jgi:hypothetical protein
MKILKMYLKVKYYEVNKGSYLHIANGTNRIHKNYQKMRSKYAKIALNVLAMQ